jgi:hypothetical protein
MFQNRVARWYISIPKFAVLVYFERPWYGNFRNGIFVVFWYTLGIFLIYQLKNNCRNYYRYYLKALQIFSKKYFHLV